VKIRGLLFDFDGLLVDTESPSRLVWEELYREHGFELPHDRWATNIGTLDEPFDPLDHLEELLGGALDREALTQRRHAREIELISLEQLRPGVDDYLSEAERRDFATAIVSSSSVEWIGPILERLERGHGWDAIVAANGDASRAKPRPTLYLDALAALGLEPHEAIAFEDSPNGVRAAKAAEIYCVAVPNPITATLGFENADLVLESFADLPLAELLKRVAGGD
jgi:beta-phosphoglucomutase-like phosphatase (HAD superfamily)